MLISTIPIANKILAALSPAEYELLLNQLEMVTLTFGEILYEPGNHINHVYFPNNCLVSLLTMVDQHQALEVGMVGPEGIIGMTLALGATMTPFRALVQGSGSALRMKAEVFQGLMLINSTLRNEVLQYAHALMTQIAQTAACNRFHVIESRLARWLLMTRDRLLSNQFHLTQEFLGHMLGVRRVGVTNAALALKRQGLINYSRGYIDIVNGAGLEAASCSCYERVNQLNINNRVTK